MIRREKPRCRPKQVEPEPVMIIGERDKLRMLEQRTGLRRDATRALPQVPTRWGSIDCPSSKCWLESDKSQGRGDSVPTFKNALSYSK
jgi:hypothetical protein